MAFDSLGDAARRMAGRVVQRGWEEACRVASVGPDTARGRRFGRFGRDSILCFPWTALYNEQWMWIGEGTRIGPYVTLSVGMVPGQTMTTNPVVRIGDRCVIGKGSGIVGHLQIEIGDDVWTGHHVYVTDQNHGYQDPDVPIGDQMAPERPVSIGAGSWLGHGAVVLPGAQIGRHVVVAAGAVVTGEVPDNCVIGGNPAKVIRRYVPGQGWPRVDSEELVTPRR